MAAEDEGMDDGTGRPLPRLRVAIADDHRLFVAGLEAWLDDLGVVVSGTASDAARLADLVRRDPPDLVVTDVSMPPGHSDEGIRFAEELDATYPDIGVLVVSGYREASWAERLFDRRQQGVGYLLKDSIDDPSVLDRALWRVARGEMVVDDKLSVDLVRRQRALRAGELSVRELEILREIAAGRSNDGIAEAFTISGRTVENHIRRIFDKLGLGQDRHEHARVRAVLWYQQNAT